MDAPNPSATPTFATRTPLHIGAVGLWVRDLDRTAAYYRDVIGLNLIERKNGVARLGAGSFALLELSERSELAADDPRAAGLYHTAFLMPTRADLARWVAHIARERTPITGASDHGVSEAFYLDDPEGNGIEVYADRPAQAWNWSDGQVAMPTKALDVRGVLAELGDGAQDAAFSGAPDGLRIGHIHLRVGDLDPAERFYRGAIGLDLTRRRHGAAFLSSGHYHHHVAANVWHSAGAQRREERAGLAWFSIVAADAETFAAARTRLAEAGAPARPGPDGIETEDPWGTRIRLQAS
jgi:catechol 2,3-dioxygenase